MVRESRALSAIHPGARVLASNIESTNPEDDPCFEIPSELFEPIAKAIAGCYRRW
jgi:hypothetical protein